MNRFLFSMLISITILSALQAQVMLKIEGDVFELSEAGAIITEKNEKVTVVLALEKLRPEENKGLDIKEGDWIFMVNGEKLQSVNQFRDMYERLETGDELKLALKRDGKPLMIKVKKMAADDLPQKVIRKAVNVDEDQEKENNGRKIIIQKYGQPEQNTETRNDKNEE